MGMDNLRDLNSMWEELVESSFTFILSVSSLNAPTSSTTIFPPGCSRVANAVDPDPDPDEEDDIDNDDDNIPMLTPPSVAAAIRRPFPRLILRLIIIGDKATGRHASALNLRNEDDK